MSSISIDFWCQIYRPEFQTSACFGYYAEILCDRLVGMQEVCAIRQQDIIWNQPVCLHWLAFIESYIVIGKNFGMVLSLILQFVWLIPSTFSCFCLKQSSAHPVHSWLVLINDFPCSSCETITNYCRVSFNNYGKLLPLSFLGQVMALFLWLFSLFLLYAAWRLKKKYVVRIEVISFWQLTTLFLN